MAEDNVSYLRRFKFGEVFKASNRREADFILAAARIANDCQLLWQLLSSSSVDEPDIAPGTMFPADAVNYFYGRLAFFCICDALKVFSDHERIFFELDQDAHTKFMEIKNGEVFNLEMLDGIKSMRDAFAHYPLLKRDNGSRVRFDRALGELSEGIYEVCDSYGPIGDEEYIRFAFADDFIMQHDLICVDPNRELNEDGLNNKIVTALLDGLAAIGTMCMLFVTHYIDKTIVRS